MRNIFILTFLFIASTLGAQNALEQMQIEVNDNFDESSKGFFNGVIANLNQNYDKAIYEFSQVNRNDSLYDNAQLQLASVYKKKKDDSSIVDVCLNAINLESEYDNTFRRYLIEALTNLGDDEVFMQLGIAKAKYPYDEDFLLYEAKAYRRFEKYEECKNVLIKVIKVNPFCGAAHYYLGKLMADQGDYVRGAMSLETFLLLASKSTAKTDTAINILDQLFNNKYDAKIKNVKRDDVFKEIEELVESKIALNAKYKPDAPLTFNMSKQSDLIIKNIKYKKGTNDFWMDFYVPYLVQVKEKKFVRAYNYQFLAFLGNPNIQKGIAKYQPEVNAYIDFASKYFRDLRDEAPMVIEGKEVIAEKHYDDGTLWGVGNTSDDLKIGKWYFFHNNGTLQSIATYDKEGKLSDSVFTFHKNGKTESVYIAKNGLANGKYTSYYDNGELRNEYIYLKDSLDGEQRDYKYNGAIDEISNFSNGKRHGLDQKFGVAGMLNYQENYRNGKLEGKKTYYYHNKQVKSEYNYKNGKAEGDFILYHKNGKVKKKGQYTNDIAVGKWEEFYSNGTPQGYFYLNEKGLNIDSSVTFYPNGKIETVLHFNKKGKIHGTEVTYNSKGKVWYIFNYKNGVVKSYSYYDLEGKLVHQGKTAIENYTEDGKIYSKGEHKKGHRVGRWEFFYPNGETKEVCTYDEFGNLNDLDEEFYASGELQSKTYYRAGNRVGEYTAYHENGKLKSKGFYVKDVARGEWNWWYSNGNLNETDYFQKGDINGMVEVYNADSTPNYEARYIMDEVRDYFYYNNKGEEIYKIVTKNGSGAYDVTNPLSRIRYVGNYKYAELDGKIKGIADNGVIIFESNYAEGERNGLQISRYPNGNLFSETNYNYGDQHGVQKWYYADGTMSSVSYYQYNELVDSNVYYYPSGAIETKNVFSNLEDGKSLYTWYYENGKVRKVKSLKNGENHGWCYDYNEQGHLYLQTYYQNGILLLAKGLSANGTDTITINTAKGSGTDSLTFFYNNGKVAFSASIKKGIFEGTVLRYYYNGQIKERVDYFHGDKNGPCVYYYTNGKINTEENFSMGELHGERKEYHESGQLIEHENYFLGELHGNVKYYNKKGLLLVDADYNNGRLLKIKSKK